MLPQFENQSIFNAYNFWHTSYDVWNATVLATGLTTLWCPSDGGITAHVHQPHCHRRAGDRPLHQLRGVYRNLGHRGL